MAQITRVRCVLGGTSGLPGLMTAYYTSPNVPPTAGDITDATGRVRAFWVAVAGQLAAGVTAQVQQSCDLIDSATGDLQGRVNASALPALVTSTGTQELPPATAGGIRLVTNTVIFRRVVQGRIFVSPLALAANTNGLPSAGLIAALGTAGTALGTGGTGIINVVWHRPDVAHSGGSVATVTGYSVDASKLWVLRSRRT